MYNIPLKDAADRWTKTVGLLEENQKITQQLVDLLSRLESPGNKAAISAASESGQVINEQPNHSGQIPSQVKEVPSQMQTANQANMKSESKVLKPKTLSWYGKH